jgi:hypothetical protein
LLLAAAAARCWTRRIGPAMALGLVAGYAGLLLSYFLNLPSGPAIVLVGGGVYLLSLIVDALSAATTGGIFGRFSEKIELNDAGTTRAERGVAPGRRPRSSASRTTRRTPHAVAAIGEAAPGGGTFAAAAASPLWRSTQTLPSLPTMPSPSPPSSSAKAYAATPSSILARRAPSGDFSPADDSVVCKMTPAASLGYILFGCRGGAGDTTWAAVTLLGEASLPCFASPG